MHILNFSEKLLLSLFRVVSLLIACSIILGLFAYILYNGYLMSKGPQDFKTPEIDVTYNYADIEGILAKKQRLERESLASKIFESKYTDAISQSNIVSTTSFRELSEIKYRYDELILTAGVNDYISRLKHKNQMYSEIENKCPKYREMHENIISELEKDITLIARNNKVDKNSFAKNAVYNLKQSQRIPPDCISASPELKKLTSQIITLFPGSYGFGGENTKDEITSIVQEISNGIVNDTSLEYHAKFIRTTEGLVEQMRLFVDKEIRDMTSKNLLTNDLTSYLSEWITAELKKHVELTLENYYVEVEKNNNINVAIENSKVNVLSGLNYLGVAMLCLIGLIIFIVSLSIERNVRKSDQ